MRIDKDMVLGFLRAKGEHGKAEEAAGRLPDQVDTDRDSGLLSGLGVDIGDLVEMVQSGGLGDLGDLGGKLGKMFGR